MMCHSKILLSSTARSTLIMSTPGWAPPPSRDVLARTFCLVHRVGFLPQMGGSLEVMAVPLGPAMWEKATGMACFCHHLWSPWLCPRQDPLRRWQQHCRAGLAPCLAVANYNPCVCPLYTCPQQQRRNEGELFRLCSLHSCSGQDRTSSCLMSGLTLPDRSGNRWNRARWTDCIKRLFVFKPVFYPTGKAEQTGNS